MRQAAVVAGRVSELRLWRPGIPFPSPASPPSPAPRLQQLLLLCCQ